MLKILILFTVFLNVTFAKSRFSDSDKERFLNEVKQEIAEHKLENRGRVDLQIIKPGFYAELEKYLVEEKFTRDEMLKIKQSYENLTKNPNITAEKAEEAFYNFINNELNEINSRVLQKIKEGNICNNWSCDENLMCAPDPIQLAQGKFKKAGSSCNESSECVSNECVEAKAGSKNKICEDVYRCFRPLSLGESCKANPICGRGACLPYNSLTSGIGECSATTLSCKKNNDCCSNSCSSGRCVENYICKDCVSKGAKTQRGQKCCEGLYENDKGVCIPDVPPSVIRQVFNFLSESLFSSAIAQEKGGAYDFEGIGGSVGGNDTKPASKPLPDDIEPAGVGAYAGGVGGSFSNSSSTNTATKSATPVSGSTSTTAAKTDTKAAAPIAGNNADDNAFLKKGAKNDGLSLESGVRQNYNKDGKIKEGSKAEAAPSKLSTIAENKPKMTFDKKSNFQTCDIHFRDDFYNALKEDGAFDLEMAMLGFDFVITGDSDKDFWTLKGVADSSIHSRLKKIGMAHRLVRAETNKKIKEAQKKLTCMCLDVQGLSKISSPEKINFFSSSCSEYAKYQDPNTSFDELNGDASGLKAKRLIAEWTKNIAEFHAALSVDNTKLSASLLEVSTWANSPEAKWSTATTEKFDLFKFSVKNPSGKIAGMGAIVGALLAAGVIAILGGFATTSILSAWATAGIISATAATGAGGLWMIASLKGAWITQRPEITDNHIAPRSYSCGKKATCMEYTRTLIQPFNDVCEIHTSSNACLKAFVVVNYDDQSSYIVDPWIPAGVSKAAILKNQALYTEKLEAAFKKAKAAMMLKTPAKGGGGKKGGGEFVAESYLAEVFIDAELVGKYVPELGLNLEEIYYMNAARAKIITDAAEKFAISEGVLLEEEKENLKAFADYAYENHFIWPKISSPGEISYPTAGLQTYLDFMTNDVAGNLSTGLADTAKIFFNLHQRHLEDYKNNLDLYTKAISQEDSIKKTLVAKELDKVSKEIDGLKTLNVILSNNTLDEDLSKLSPGFLESQAKIAGANSYVDLSASQKKFIQAVGDLRLRRKAQLKSLATYQRAMNSRGDKERTTKMAIVSKAFNDKFTTKSRSFSGSRLGKASSNSGSSSASSSFTSSADDNKGLTNGLGGINEKGSTPSSQYSNAYYGNDGSSRGGSGYGSGSSGSDSSKDLVTDSAASEAESKLADAIDARNSTKKEKYESNDGQTLFEKVTNAYIRNYDKVLTKRKDKDVIEEQR